MEEKIEKLLEYKDLKGLKEKYLSNQKEIERLEKRVLELKKEIENEK